MRRLDSCGAFRPATLATPVAMRPNDLHNKRYYDRAGNENGSWNNQRRSRYRWNLEGQPTGAIASSGS
jgi:hypothetical protein